MAAICKKPKDCQHPTCSEGECKKCAYNPRSNYPPWHCGQPSKHQFGPVAMAITVAAGLFVYPVFAAGLGMVLFLTAIATGITFLVAPTKPPKLPVEFERTLRVWRVASVVVWSVILVSVTGVMLWLAV